jgi:type VI secretion system protein ImpL
MKTIIGFLKQKWVIQLLGVLALCVLIWFAGPKFTFAKKAPLESEFNRLLAILAAVTVWAVYNLIMQARANKKDQELMADLAAPQVDQAQAAIDEAQNEEAAVLRRKFEEALQLLRKTRAKGRRDRQYLYELPWYVIIGAPGAGKTTLLVNSGLRFPLSERLGADPIQGVGGTRNCDWLFADEAIFLDTAGRYTTQDSHQPVDAAAWRGFLDLIKKYRPRRPINGVMVAMSMSDLLRQTDEERRQHAKVVRQRILELYEVLGVRFPIYMLFTKCDLVAGFADFFAQLSQEHRAQVWGETFPGEDLEQTDEHIARFDANFDALIQRLNQRTFRRIQEERDIQRRSLILDFPQQMGLSKPAMKGFLQDTFGTSRYEETAPLLRGVYFTSGTQEGTPIDRVMGILAATYGLDRQKMPVFSGQGKSFFITNLLKKVIFPEAELAGADLRVERRQRWLNWAAYGSLMALTACIIALWTVSYARNKRAIGLVKNQIEQYQNAAKETTGWDDGVRSLLARLNIMQEANDVYRPRSWWMGFGLYQGDKIQDGIQRVYGEMLRNNLLPLVKARLEQRIHARLYGTRDDDMSALYELLKVYLMLGQPKERMDPILAGPWINNDWKQSFPREPKIQDQLRVHSDNLLKLPLDPIQLNELLIAEARQILNARPLYAQIYADWETEAKQVLGHSHDFRLQDVVPPHSDQVFTTANGEALKTVTIPGLYTYHGYHEFFEKKGLDDVKTAALRKNWVLNNYAADQESDFRRLYDDLQKHYFDQYEKLWRGLLDNLKIKRAGGISEAIKILDILSGSETPLRPLLEAVEKNTTLTGAPAKDTSGTDSEQADFRTKATSITDWALQSDNAPNYALKLEEAFEDINYLVRSNGASPSPLDNVLTNLNEVRDFMMQMSGAAKSDERALEMAMERMGRGGASDSIKGAQIEFARQPEPFKSWFSSLTSSGWKFTLASAKSELNTIWKTDVLAPYTAGLQGRYPLYKNSQHEATLTDFSRFFMPNGIIDQFFENHLKPFVDRTRSKWRPVAMDNQNLGLSGEVLRQFQYAAKIRDIFFSAGGPTPSVQFELKPVSLDENIATFRINLEGQTAEYRHGPTRPTKFLWPGPQTNAGVRLIFQTLEGREISQSEEGPWAWLKTLDKATVESTNLPDRFIVTFHASGYKARYELRASSVYNPFRLTELQNFRCPEAL